MPGRREAFSSWSQSVLGHDMILRQERGAGMLAPPVLLLRLCRALHRDRRRV
jgi:hypothetical protein